MNIALLHKHYSEEHLEYVKSEMERIGAPVIKAVWMECYNHWAALEGCHRIRAAHALGITPIIEEVDYSDDEFCGNVISHVCDTSHDTIVFTFSDMKD